MPQKQRCWTVKRHYLAKPEGWSRWDQAYQALLTWTDQTNEEEKNDENSILRTCFEHASLRTIKRSNSNSNGSELIASHSGALRLRSRSFEMKDTAGRPCGDLA